MAQAQKKDRTVLLAIGLVGCLGCMAPGVLFAGVGAFFFLLRSEARPVTADSGWTSYKPYESNEAGERDDDEPAVAILGSKKSDLATTSDSYDDEEYEEEAEVASTPVHVETPAPTATPIAVRTAEPVRTPAPVPVRTATPVPVRTSAPVVRATSTPIARATATPAPVARVTAAPRATATPLPWEEELAEATPAPAPTPVRVAAVDPNKRVIHTQSGAASVTVGKNLAIKATDGKTAVGQLVDVKEGNVDVRISGKLMRIHESQILEAAEF